MKATTLATGICLAIPALASTGRDGHGLIGYGIKMYQPPCAFACQSAIGNSLECPMDEHHDMDMEGMKIKRMNHGGEMPSAECYANNEPYLQTLAYCIEQRCPDSVKTSAREKFFEMSIGGRLKKPPVPMYTYAEALMSIDSPPTNSTPVDDMLMQVSLVEDEDYLAAYNGNHGFEISEGKNSLYSIILIVTGILMPVASSCIPFYLLPKRLGSRINGYLNYPPLVGTRHSAPILNLILMPTRGQTIFLFYLIAINFIFCAVDYDSQSPNSWYNTPTDQIRSFIGNRTGALSLVNIALATLYAGRNNVLISITDWSHTTYLLLHRWVASISMLQAVIHSIIYLYNYMLSGEHATEAKLDYWVWGVIATLGLVFLIPTSTLPIRQKFYELFLVWHILMAWFIILGSFLHIYLRFSRQWGYELWMYIAWAFWGFDRITRICRLARNGVCKAQITIIDDDYVRLDIPGVTGEGQAYLYFPTLTWRVWENHPFSVAGGVLLNNIPATPDANTKTINSSASSAHNSPNDFEKDPNLTITAVSKPSPANSTRTPTPTLGLSFIVRTHKGTTSLLRSRSYLPVLVESGYTGSRLHPIHEVLNHHPRLLGIAGGVGVTAILPLLASHRGSRKLAWGVRHESLIHGLRDLTTDSHAMAGVEFETVVGRRLDLKGLVEAEAADVHKEGSSLAVVVSGPPGMADEVRCAVAEVAKRGIDTIFVEESYSW